MNHRVYEAIWNENALIQLAQCRFHGLAIPNAKVYGSNFIQQHSETVMVWNYQNADYSLRKKIVIYYNFRHTFVPYSVVPVLGHSGCWYAPRWGGWIRTAHGSGVSSVYLWEKEIAGDEVGSRTGHPRVVMCSEKYWVYAFSHRL